MYIITLQSDGELDDVEAELEAVADEEGRHHRDQHLGHSDVSSLQSTKPLVFYYTRVNKSTAGRLFV